MKIIIPHGYFQDQARKEAPRKEADYAARMEAKAKAEAASLALLRPGPTTGEWAEFLGLGAEG